MGVQENKIKIYRPAIDGRKVTYYSNGEHKTVEFSKYKDGSIGLAIAKNFHDYAFKDKDINNGNIQRKDAIKILQNIFAIKYERATVTNAEDAAAFSDVKDLFELYMDKDSDGGEKITQKEQAEILDIWGFRFGKY